MLVSMIGQLQAISARHNAMSAMMGISNARMGMIRNMNCNASGFGSAQYMRQMHQADLNMSLDFEKNKILYQIANAQEEALKKRQAQEIKRAFDISA